MIYDRTFQHAFSTHLEYGQAFTNLEEVLGMGTMRQHRYDANRQAQRLGDVTLPVDQTRIMQVDTPLQEALEKQLTRSASHLTP